MMSHDVISLLKAGKNPPAEVYVVIEIPKGSNIKYEFDIGTGLIFVDRELSTSMTYPGNYGFIPQTRTEKGDPVDVLMLFEEPLVPMCVVACRPIGVLLSEDQDGNDPKIIAVPVPKIDPSLAHINDIAEIDESRLAQIKHFIEHHKDLEDGKYVRILGWAGREAAMKIIKDGMESYANK
jgi:inorganic pyrophosphatase